MTDTIHFQSQSIIGGPNRVQCDDRGCKVVDPDEPVLLELKSGDKIDLGAVDELAAELFSLPRERFVVELWSPEELHEDAGRATLGLHSHDDWGDGFSVIAVDENLTGKEAAEVLAHELTHATHADLLFGDGKAMPGSGAVYDATAEQLAQAGAALHEDAIFERAILPGHGGAPAGGGGLHRPAAETTSKPDALDWPAPVRLNREREQGSALQRRRG